jgi:threonine dehydratase
VTYSSGNHAAAVAHAARRFAVPATIFAPVDAPEVKLAAVRALGATITPAGTTSLERRAAAVAYRDRTGAALIEPFDHPDTIAGQGTATLELLNATGGLDALSTPVGGGGLASGCALSIAALAPDCELLLAEPAGAADTARSLAAGRLDIDFVPDTICDGLRGTLGEPNFALLRAHAVETLVVEDRDTVEAMRLAWSRMKQVIEPSSATVLAALLRHRGRFAGLRVGAVLSGGNVDLDDIAALFAKARA